MESEAGRLVSGENAQSNPTLTTKPDANSRIGKAAVFSELCVKEVTILSGPQVERQEKQLTLTLADNVGTSEDDMKVETKFLVGGAERFKTPSKKQNAGFGGREQGVMRRATISFESCKRELSQEGALGWIWSLLMPLWTRAALQ